MSTSTITSRKSCGTAERASTIESCESRSSPRASIDLVCKVEDLLLETHAVACLSRDAASVGVGSGLAHSHDPSSAFPDIATRVTSLLFPFGESGCRERGHDRVAARAPLVPGQRDLADEVGVRLLEPVVPPEGGSEPHH